MLTEEELERLKAIAEELHEMHNKNSDVRFLFCYDKGETSTVTRYGTDANMVNFIQAFLRSDGDAAKVVTLALMSHMA